MTVLCLVAIVFGAMFAVDTVIDHRRHARAIARWCSNDLITQVGTPAPAQVRRPPGAGRIMRRRRR